MSKLTDAALAAAAEVGRVAYHVRRFERAEAGDAFERSHALLEARSAAENAIDHVRDLVDDLTKELSDEAEALSEQQRRKVV